MIVIDRFRLLPKLTLAFSLLVVAACVNPAKDSEASDFDANSSGPELSLVEAPEDYDPGTTDEVDAGNAVEAVANPAIIENTISPTAPIAQPPKDASNHSPAPTSDAVAATSIDDSSRETPNAPQKPLAATPESRAGDAIAATNYEATLTSILTAAISADGLVNYDLLRGKLNAEFRTVLKAIEDFSGPLETFEQRLSFWMNAYNVQMLQNIIETPTVTNIIADGYGDQFFKTKLLTANRGISLDELENTILRGARPGTDNADLFVGKLDPRIHVGINCAAVSCPTLRPEAFSAATVDEQLDDAMRIFANSNDRIGFRDGKLVLSSIIDWFADDIEAGDDGQPGSFLLSFIDSSRPDFDKLVEKLDGTTVQELKASEDVTFEYSWIVNADN